MSRSYVNLADVTTKRLLNGETQVFVCVIEFKTWLMSCFWKTLGKKKSVANEQWNVMTNFFHFYL